VKVLGFAGVVLWSAAAVVWFAMFSVASCKPTTVPSYPDADAAYVTQSAEAASMPQPDPLPGEPCSVAGANLRKLHCPEGYGVSGGMSFEDVCRASQGAVDLKLDCLTKAQTPEDVRACCPSPHGCSPVHCSGVVGAAGAR
jgi:hypothetical protein